MYDAIIVGARCAGASTAMLLARKDHRALLVDRAKFPSDASKTDCDQNIQAARLGPLPDDMKALFAALRDRGQHHGRLAPGYCRFARSRSCRQAAGRSRGQGM
ncbi:MAG: hypothetical protein ACREK9_18485 [Candidatus Rokuibacteriota bacterium]